MDTLTSLAKPFGEEAPKIGPPAQSLEPSYMDGSVSKLEGANPGRDQDRSRMDECQGASYHYGSSEAQHDSASDTDAGF